MSPKSTGTALMSASDVKNRAAQARSFLETARLATDFADDVGTDAAANVIASNAVLAGIAAADAVCGKALGIRSNTPNHVDAVALLRRAHGGEAAANHLKSLVAVKSASAYEPRLVTSAKASEALRHAERLIAIMEKILS